MKIIYHKDRMTIEDFEKQTGVKFELHEKIDAWYAQMHGISIQILTDNGYLFVKPRVVESTLKGAIENFCKTYSLRPYKLGEAFLGDYSKSFDMHEPRMPKLVLNYEEPLV